MPNVRDANLTVTKALSNGAGTVLSDGIDLGLSSRSDFVAGAEFLIEGPAHTTALLPDAETQKYTIQHDDDPAFGTVADLDLDALVQTGAGAAGCVAASKRRRHPVERQTLRPLEGRQDRHRKREHD